MSATEKGSDDKVRLTRRSLLSHSVSAGTVVLVPLVTSSCAAPVVLENAQQNARQADGQTFTPIFNVQQRQVLSALVDRLVPADELGPAASDCGVLTYIERSLASWNQADVSVLIAGISALDAAASSEYQQAFAALDESTQDALLMQMEAGGFAEPAAQAAFSRIHRLTLEGMFSDPYYGGNRNYAGWDLLGYPGAVMASNADMQKMGGRLPALHTSAYGADHDGH